MMKKIVLSLLFILNAFFLNACSHHHGYRYGGYYPYGGYVAPARVIPPRAVVRPRVREPFYYGGKPVVRPMKPARNYGEALIRQQRLQNRINRRNYYRRHHYRRYR